MSTTHKTTDELIESCQGLVWALAKKISRDLPPHIELEDLAAYGQVGLAEAANSYDAGRGVKFSTFAYYRVRGAIYDGLTKMLWFRQQPRGKIKFDQMANDFLEAEFSETATIPLPLEAEAIWLQDVVSSLAVVFFASIGCGEGEPNDWSLVDPAAVSPLETLGGKELHAALRSLVTALPSEERILIQSTYFEGLSLQKAADRMEISKSWASRLHAKTLRQLAESVSRLGFAD